MRAFDGAGVVGGLWAVCLAGGVAACGQDDAQRAGPPPPPVVEVAPVVRRDVPTYLFWLAALDGSVTADVRPRVSGYLTDVAYREGSRVDVGQPLFDIDARPYRAALRAAEGQLTQAQAALEQARSDVARYEPLVAQRAVSRQELDAARAAFETARGRVESAEAELRRARLDLTWTHVTSPIAGIAGIARFRVGSLVGPESVLTTVSTIDPMRASFAISEEEYLRVSDLIARLATGPDAGPEVALVLPDGRVYPHLARVVTAAREIDPQTGTLTLQAHFPNPDGLLRPGLSGRVRMRTEAGRDALVVQQRALQEVQGRFFVAVVGPDDVVQMRPVTLGARTGDVAVVTEGLREGERVVVEGLQLVRDGVRVQPRPVATPPATSALEGPVDTTQAGSPGG